MYDTSTIDLEDAMLFIESAPANIFFKDTECKYRFVTELCNFLNGGEEHSILGKTDLEVQTNPELAKFYFEDDLKILKTGEGSEYVSDFSTPEFPAFFEIRNRRSSKTARS